MVRVYEGVRSANLGNIREQGVNNGVGIISGSFSAENNL